jgi:hypothetical protein
MATRIRRGKEVIIPEEWVGKLTTKKTKRQRLSNLIGKVARIVKNNKRGSYKDRKWAIID